MADSLPLVPISPDRLSYLLAALLVYRQYRLRYTPQSEERSYTLLVLDALLPKLHCGIQPHEGEMPLWLTVDEVGVMKSGLSMLIERLKGKPASRSTREEITHLQELKTMLDQHFSSTQD